MEELLSTRRRGRVEWGRGGGCGTGGAAPQATGDDGLHGGRCVRATHGSASGVAATGCGRSMRGSFFFSVTTDRLYTCVPVAWDMGTSEGGGGGTEYLPVSSRAAYALKERKGTCLSVPPTAPAVAAAASTGGTATAREGGDGGWPPHCPPRCSSSLAGRRPGEAPSDPTPPPPSSLQAESTNTPPQRQCWDGLLERKRPHSSCLPRRQQSGRTLTPARARRTMACTWQDGPPHRRIHSRAPSPCPWQGPTAAAAAQRRVSPAANAALLPTHSRPPSGPPPPMQRVATRL